MVCPQLRSGLKYLKTYRMYCHEMLNFFLIMLPCSQIATINLVGTMLILLIGMMLKTKIQVVINSYKMGPFKQHTLAVVGLFLHAITLHCDNSIVAWCWRWCYPCSELLGTKERWPWLLGFNGFTALLQLSTLPFLPESPKFLLLDRGDRQACERGVGKRFWIQGIFSTDKSFFACMLQRSPP